MTIAVAPSIWVWLIFFGLLFLIIYFDFTARPGRNRVVRLVMMIIGISALLALYARPFQEVEPDQVSVAFVSSATEESTLDSLKKLDYRLLSSKEEYQTLSEKNVIDKLIVTGNGLSFEELEGLGRPFMYIPSKMNQEGPVEMRMEEAIVEAPTQVMLRIVLKDSLTMTLSGTGIESSDQKVDQGNQQVSFEVTPKVAGHLTWQLDGIRNKDTVFSEIVPLEVLENTKTAVLMLGNAPSFEYRFLKNYLAESGFGIAERIQVSGDVFREAFTDLEERSLSSLTAKKLEAFSLVVLDATLYTDLTSREKNNLKSKLKLGELGLVWMNNVQENELVDTRKVQSTTLEFSGESRTIVLESSEMRLKSPDQKLTKENNLIGEIKEYGLGKIVVPEISESYTAILRGNKEFYAGIWQTLLQPVVGSKWSETTSSIPQFPRVGERMTASVFSSEMLPPTFVDSVRIAHEQQWYHPEKWNMEVWPLSRGWNSVLIGEDVAEKFFAFDSTDWKVQKIWKQREQTRIMSESAKSPDREEKKISQPVSRWYFFFAFLFSFGFLWIEQRLS